MSKLEYGVYYIGNPKMSGINDVGELIGTRKTEYGANALAERRAHDQVYGTCVVDRMRETIDWGDSVTDFWGAEEDLSLSDDDLSQD